MCNNAGNETYPILGPGYPGAGINYSVGCRMWKLNRANYSGSQDSADLANFNYFICSSAAKIFSQEFKTFNAMQA